MSAFDAIFLHGVMDYSRGAKPTPSLPDFKDLQKRLSDAKRLDDNDCAQELDSIASDFDYDNEIEQYVDKAYEKIDLLHRGIRDACAALIQNWDPDNMTRDQMITFVENLQDDLEGYLPESVVMRAIAFAWFGYEVAPFIQAHHALNSIPLSYHTTDDQYHGALFDEALGRLEVKAGQDGVLTLTTKWKPGKLVFSSDKKILLSTGDPKDSIFAMPIADFSKNFEDWSSPTEEEIALFDVLYPGADWTVLRYLREYHEKKYISNTRPITTVPTNSLISVSTSL